MTIGRAFARAGLLGNPSDGYGGRVIATTLPMFEARATVVEAAAWDCGGVELLDATITALGKTHPSLVDRPAVVSFTTTIPYQVGLSGSSAIIIAALRALAERSSFTWDNVELAKLALAVETDVLGWAAGPQDRVVQAHEGLLDMDFAQPWQAHRYEPLDPAQLPALFVAWNQSMGESSNVAHSQIRERWLAGDQLVHDTMREFAELAGAGRSALDAGTAAAEWPALMRRGFALRERIWNITAVDRALVETGTLLGAGVAFAGSGGAVVGCPTDVVDLPQIATAYRDLGAGFEILNA